ncbi:MAG: hypothetical protein P4L40_18725 [Terracidiphilus sp.]|nr:hypothetical protein [Terracidiphilus sp.]
MTGRTHPLGNSRGEQERVWLRFPRLRVCVCVCARVCVHCTVFSVTIHCCRTQEIFLDYLSSKCNRLEAQNLLNARFTAQLTEGKSALVTCFVNIAVVCVVCAATADKALHDCLVGFMNDLPDVAKRSSAFVSTP